LLALRLPRYRCRTAQGDDGRWRVAVELADSDMLPALVEAVEVWLEREQIASTEVRFGDEAYRLRPDGHGRGIARSRQPVG
jgi:hypothetical protein